MLEEKLKEVFGYDAFRGNQKTIIENVVSGRDALVIMPTGGGKSMCYQLPALVLDGLTIVVSPLIALMKDQVNALQEYGVPAAYLNSSLTRGEQNKVITNVQFKKTKLLYISPERLFSGDGYLLKFFEQIKISLVAIDEAHCITQWGHDFREEYLNVKFLKIRFPNSPIIALTATADEKTRDAILEILNLDNPEIFISSFDRPNIKYDIRPKKRTNQIIEQYLRNHPKDSGIIYALSRKGTEDTADYLRQRGFNVAYYHAGMDTKERNTVQEKFLRDEFQVIVATVAFGMGIDKSNVRFVIHKNLPKSIEAYYQETGRAGRDGINSEAILFYSKADAMMLKEFIMTDNLAFNENLLTKLKQMSMYAETLTCRRAYILNYFGEPHDGNCGFCDNCLTEREFIDGTVIAQKAISAVARLKQSYGATYTIDFLRGSKSQKIKDHHRSIKTYGVGDDLTKDEWQAYMQQLIDQNYLTVTEGKYPVLQLGNRSNDIIKDGKKIQLIKIKAQKKLIAIRKDYDTSLFEQLRQKRTELAKAAAVPAYIIFSDKTLVDLASKQPTKLADLNDVNGFGKVKIQRYGEAFIDVINRYKALN